MMMFFFDFLPVELLQNIFRYLWAHEILHGFSNQSDYLDSVLQSYNRYAICLCSMLKSQFDQICHRIQPKQVFALAFLDEDGTPDQFTLFFSHFDVQQFVNLRSFAIVSFEPTLFRKLDLLCCSNQFKSILVPEFSGTYWTFSGSQVETVLPDLKRLFVSQYRLTKPLPCLQHLTIPHCYCYKLEYLFSFVPNIRSLNISVSLDIFPYWSKKIPSMNHLRQLTLRIQYGRLTMGQMHEILIKSPRLTHLELELNDPMDVIGDEKWKTWIKHLKLDIEEAMDIVDGNQWKYLVSNLQTFNFRFFLAKKPSTEMLDSFRSSFWLEQKRWFVVFDDNSTSPSLFTVPRFAPKDVIYSSNYHSLDCTPADLCLEQFVSTLNLPVCRPLIHDFLNVTSLALEMQENCVLNELLPYLQLPHLYSLSFTNLSLLDVLTAEVVLRSIHILNVNTAVSKTNSEQISVIFPRIERLQITIDDDDTMFSFINGLKYLSIAKFTHRQASFPAKLTQQWFEERSSRLNSNNQFTYRIDTNIIQLWMSIE